MTGGTRCELKTSEAYTHGYYATPSLTHVIFFGTDFLRYQAEIN